MTQETQNQKNFFQLNGGINTEINELNFPDGFSRDEANYELLVDGSRRRRKGLAAETGVGTALTVPTFTATAWNQSYLWKNVGGDPDKEMLVYRKGNSLYFATADETVSGGWVTGASGYIGMVALETSGSTTANTDDQAVSFSQGRGYLFVTGPYIYPFYVVYDTTADTYESVKITPYIRDFTTIEDGTGVSSEPTGTITADHRYNLRNRGWKQADMTTYVGVVAKHPARNALWWKGYKRALTASTDYDFDGVQSFDSTKLDAEAFGNSSAPKGSLFLDPHDTSTGIGNSAGTVVAISTWVRTSSSVITITATSHGISVGETFQITGNSFKYWVSEGPDLYESTNTLNGSYTAATVADVNTITISKVIFGWDSWSDQFISKGEVDSTLTLDRSSGAVHTDSFRACEFHDGRLFLAGMRNTEMSDTITFSQIVDAPQKLNRHYQQADPTDEKFNALTSADGGTIVIPGLGGVLNMISVRNSLLVLATTGVWEVSGGQRGVFTADGYSVRKITDNGMSSPTGYQAIEGSLAYTGDGGIYIIGPNQYTGALEAASASEKTVQTLWNQVPDAEQKKVQCSYDDALKRLYILYGADTTQSFMDTALIFDGRAGAWFKYTFDQPANNGLLTGFAISNADDTSSNKKMKFLYEASTTTVQVADFDQTSFNDWDGTNGPLPFMLTGHDNIGDWQRRRQAPIITVFSKRTETAYTDTGTGYDPVNDSSTLLTPFWDWTESTQWTTTGRTAQEAWDGSGKTTNPSISNKIGDRQEVYKHARNYVPSGITDVDGYPVVVTRNKVRGRGRALQLRFDGATDKDSHILGFTTNYKVSRKK